MRDSRSEEVAVDLRRGSGQSVDPGGSVIASRQFRRRTSPVWFSEKGLRHRKAERLSCLDALWATRPSVANPQRRRGMAQSTTPHFGVGAAAQLCGFQKAGWRKSQTHLGPGAFSLLRSLRHYILPTAIHCILLPYCGLASALVRYQCLSQVTAPRGLTYRVSSRETSVGVGIRSAESD
jgi:hypothetical protein